MNTTNTQDPIKLALPFALFDEFGNGADDRVLDHIKSVVAALQPAAAQPPGFDAHDMATAAADGFRDGVASTQASEPSAWHLELLRRVRGYVKEASTRYYDGTDGASTRQSAAHLLKQIEEAVAAAPARAVEPPTEVRESIGVIRDIMEFIRLHPKDPGGFDPELAEQRVNARLDKIERALGITTTPAAKEQS